MRYTTARKRKIVEAAMKRVLPAYWLTWETYELAYCHVMEKDPVHVSIKLHQHKHNVTVAIHTNDTTEVATCHISALESQLKEVKLRKSN